MKTPSGVWPAPAVTGGIRCASTASRLISSRQRKMIWPRLIVPASSSRAGKPVENVDLVLGPGTKVKGRVTVGKDKKPVAKVGVSAVIDKGSIPAELEARGHRYYRSMNLYSWTQTDGDGRYEFLLGPGEYQLRGPARVEPVKLTIAEKNPPRELVRTS